jgi:hypothetical protein
MKTNNNNNNNNRQTLKIKIIKGPELENAEDMHN